MAQEKIGCRERKWENQKCKRAKWREKNLSLYFKCYGTHAFLSLTLFEHSNYRAVCGLSCQSPCKPHDLNHCIFHKIENVKNASIPNEYHTYMYMYILAIVFWEKERVSKLIYPTLQHCLRMLYTTTLVTGNWTENQFHLSYAK